MEKFINLFLIENIVNSKILGEFILQYVGMLAFDVAFLANIFGLDKVEYRYKVQRKYLKFKHNIFFIVQASQNKKVIAKKIFVFEVLNYLLIVLQIGICILCIFLEYKTALIITICTWGVSILFGAVPTIMYYKAQKKYGHENALK